MIEPCTCSSNHYNFSQKEEAKSQQFRQLQQDPEKSKKLSVQIITTSDKKKRACCSDNYRKRANLKRPKLANSLQFGPKEKNKVLQSKQNKDIHRRSKQNRTRNDPTTAITTRHEHRFVKTPPKRVRTNRGSQRIERERREEER